MNWRRCLIAWMFTCCVSISAIAQTAVVSPRVVTTDWAVTETLMAIGHPPVGVGEKYAYERWVKAPALPETVADIGLRVQPNIELLQYLKPDMVINASWFQNLLLKHIPAKQVHVLDFFTAQGIEWAHTVACTLTLGELVGKVDQTKAYIASVETALAAYREQLAGKADRPVVVVQFIDARHLRVFGKNSLYDAVLQKIGLTNAWQGQTNAWGVSNAELAQLASLPANTRLIVVHPHPSNVKQQLDKSLLWQRLPFSDPNNTIVLPAIWNFGALPAMQRFAQTLTAHLTMQESTSW
jgi:ABC-type Fe3+-hydroxamate transport system substrate-binding protein